MLKFTIAVKESKKDTLSIINTLPTGDKRVVHTYNLREKEDLEALEVAVEAYSNLSLNGNQVFGPHGVLIDFEYEYYDVNGIATYIKLEKAKEGEFDQKDIDTLLN